MTDKLEPCPFCGGEAGWSVEGEPGHENSWISCRDCGSSANDMETWNRRAPAPTADGGVREAERILEKLLMFYAPNGESGWNGVADDAREFLGLPRTLPKGGL